MNRKKRSPKAKKPSRPVAAEYATMLNGAVELLDAARRASARAVNSLMTATYWELGRRIVESEQRGAQRADYGTELIERLSADLSNRFGRGYSQRNLEQMRMFYLTWPIPQTLSAEFETAIELHEQEPAFAPRQRRFYSVLRALAARFALPWSHYNYSFTESFAASL